MISTLAALKRKMVEKPWLYEAEEHVVLKLAEDAIKFIQEISYSAPADDMDGNPEAASYWLKEHE